MSQNSNPEIGLKIDAGGIVTNYHDVGTGHPAVMIHGSGPGVSAWANWRLNIGPLAKQNRIIAPDMVGFGFTDRPPEAVYGKDLWVEHLDNLMAALGIEQFDIIGNSFGGGLALAYSIRFPEKVRRLVLMGSVGISFPLTDGLDAVWGYQPSIANMKRLLNIFAYDDTIVTDELAELRYRASIRPGVQESYANMFSTPRQNGIESLASPEEAIAGLRHEALIIHGREDKVIPPDNALRLFSLLTNAQLHMFGRCGHWTQIEHADRFNCLVSDFLG